ncbi:MAG: hypothetical protein GC146_16765 [Limimaricola sp.]|uniref:cobalamin B12-binding domain-containing protein n=1 Tax=Limimaricola sp. TaxID=2211665 RepID=UPI001D92FB5A|nr:B12-binding domain-containing protein [Limimaricola sp.]MBI1418871.1 hypothetical protein [Limimaricola sp.]
MPSLDRSSAQFDSEAFEEADNGIQQLRQKLPEDAVRRLALEVVTRLIERTAALPETLPLPSDGDIDHLCDLLIAVDARSSARHIEDLLDRGAPPELIYLGYLARSAQRLGTWWEEDRVSFLDVTLAAGRIYAIMRGLRPHFAPVAGIRQRRAIFCSVPGEDHLLGVSMAADLFRRQGWDISLKVGLGHNALLSELAADPDAVVGLSCSGQHSAVPLAQLMVAMRIDNPKRLILVSGQIIETSPDVVRTLSPDALAPDVPTALAELARLAQLAAPD